MIPTFFTLVIVNATFVNQLDFAKYESRNRKAFFRRWCLHINPSRCLSFAINERENTIIQVYVSHDFFFHDHDDADLYKSILSNGQGGFLHYCGYD